MAYGDVPIILKTVNGGATWSALVSGISTNLYSIYFVDSNTGWVVGKSGVIRKTTDGGLSWFPQTSGTSQALWSVRFLDVNFGWTVGEQGTILETTNGGSTWTPQNSGTTANLYSIFSVNSNAVYVVGGSAQNGIILKRTVAPPPPTNIRINPSVTTSQSEMSIAVSPLNNNVLLASAIVTDFPWTSTIGLHAYWSTDGGLTWQRYSPNPSPLCVDPAVAIDLKGYFYISGMVSNKTNFGQGLLRSTDGGSSWTYIQVEIPSAGWLDKNHLTVDNSPTSKYKGNLYTAWTDRGQPSPKPIWFKRSTDQGVSWTNGRPVSGSTALLTQDCQGVNLQVGPNGEVYAAWAIKDNVPAYAERAIGFNKSTDGGLTWGNAVHAIDNILGIGTDPNAGPYFAQYRIRTNSFPSIAVSQQTGHVYIAWANIGEPGLNTGHSDIQLIKSTDGGTTWSTPSRVSDDPSNNSHQWFPWIAIDPITDDLSLIYYDERNNIGLPWADVTAARSTDGGAHFENFVVSERSFFVGQLGSTGFNEGYNGDYIGIAARGGKAYAVWNSRAPFTNSQAWIAQINYAPTPPTTIESTFPIFGYILHQNYPNPFNPSTTIRFAIPKTSHVLLRVYNVLGDEVASLVDQERPAGVYQVQFNASNLPSGVYFYRLQAGDFLQTRKLVLIK